LSAFLTNLWSSLLFLQTVQIENGDNYPTPRKTQEVGIEKNDPNLSCGLLPVCFIRYPSKKHTGEKLSFVKITSSKSFTKNYEIFITGNMEATIKPIMVHDTI
jgi:hypothetical protein